MAGDPDLRFPVTVVVDVVEDGVLVADEAVEEADDLAVLVVVQQEEEEEGEQQFVGVLVVVLVVVVVDPTQLRLGREPAHPDTRRAD